MANWRNILGLIGGIAGGTAGDPGIALSTLGTTGAGYLGWNKARDLILGKKKKLPPPPPPPDLTRADRMARQYSETQRLLLQSRGRRSYFLGGAAAPPQSRTSVLGS